MEGGTMRRKRSLALAWAGLVLVWAGSARGQAAPGTQSDDTITREQSHTGVMTVSGKEYLLSGVIVEGKRKRAIESLYTIHAPCAIGFQ